MIYFKKLKTIRLIGLLTVFFFASVATAGTTEYSFNFSVGSGSFVYDDGAVPGPTADPIIMNFGVLGSINTDFGDPLTTNVFGVPPFQFVVQDNTFFPLKDGSGNLSARLRLHDDGTFIIRDASGVNIIQVGTYSIAPALSPEDIDEDGINDDADNCPAVPNADQLNQDMDAAGDACDICPYDPLNDADGDGFCSGMDNCPATSNPGQEDTDNDGFGDACNAAYDTDGDEWADIIDNCPGLFNDAQADADTDGIGDVCDVCPVDPDNDADGDGFCADVDNCPLVNNSGQTDTDGDLIGNSCDSDDDNDGVSDASPDNCPLTPNADQSDFDSDGQGDVCDNDADGDQVTDAGDQCLGTSLGSVVNNDGCAIAQICPDSNSWKNHGAYVKCVAHASNDFVEDGLITDEEKDAIVSEAGSSDVGKK